MRRRRTRGTWFPTIGTEVVPLEDTVAGRQFQITLGPTAVGTTTGIIPLTFDTPFEGEGVQPGVDSLSDIVGSEYVLQRIVGKMHANRVTQRNSVTGLDENPAILFGAGIFVARANDAASGGGQDTPIGSATEAERRDNYSPLEVDTIREPWIWRRTWILGSAGQNRILNSNIAVSSEVSASYPCSTALYGSVADGPHIDSRVKRRVSQDNRLWLAVSTTPFPLGATTIEANLSVFGYFDYRIFGSLRKARNTSAF